MLDIVGVVGALVGEFIFNMLDMSAPNGVNIDSIFVAFIGAVVVLMLYPMVFRRRSDPCPSSAVSQIEDGHEQANGEGRGADGCRFG